MMTPDDVIRQLDDAKPADLVGPRLVQELKDQERAGTLSLDALLAMQSRLDEAMAQLTEHSNRSARIIKRCLSLPPIPSKRTPLGL